MISRLKSGRFIYPGPTNRVHAWAYLPDLAQAFVRVAERRSQLRGPHRLRFAGHSISADEMHQALETATGRTLRVGDLPWGFIRFASPFVPSWRELLVMRYLWQRLHRLDDSALRGLIGTPQHTPLPQALAAALADLGLQAAPPLARA